MAKYRPINTKFWTDSYIFKLSSDEKLVYNFLFTNEKTNICGIYELPQHMISIFTGIRFENINIILEKFERDGKIVYVAEWMYVINFVKNQMMNDKVRIGVKRGLEAIPSKILNEIKKVDAHFNERYSNFI